MINEIVAADEAANYAIAADDADLVADKTKNNKANKADKANVAIEADDTNEAVGASAVAETNDFR